MFGQETTVTPTAYGWSTVARKPPFNRPVAIRTTDEVHSGKASLLIEWEAKGRPKNSGVVSQIVSAVPYLGKRIRLIGFAKSDLQAGNGGLWMRVDVSHLAIGLGSLHDVSWW